MRIYTRTGDSGDTGLFGGGRVTKDHLRVRAYGAVDELNAVVGFGMALAPAQFERALLGSIQRDLFAVGARLASPEPAKVAQSLDKATLTEERIAEFERRIDAAERGLKPLKAFILPGGSPKGAALHFARTVCRRAERDVVALARTEPLPPLVVPYLNRLGDLLFVLARVANRKAGKKEEQW